MKNLEVKELSRQEVKEINGGATIGCALGVTALVLAALNTDWDQAAEDFSRGFNS